MWKVVYREGVEEELLRLPKLERTAVIRGRGEAGSLRTTAGVSPYERGARPCRVAGALRELRPRAGRSPWRVLYRRVGAVFVLAAIGPEAVSDQRGFDQAAVRAGARLDQVEED
jgi:hypothetical protein